MACTSIWQVAAYRIKLANDYVVSIKKRRAIETIKKQPFFR